MPNPLSNQTTTRKGALMDLREHLGYLLLLERLGEILADDYSQLSRVTGLQEIGRAQGSVIRLRQIVGTDRVPGLLDRMLEEYQMEEAQFASGAEEQ